MIDYDSHRKTLIDDIRVLESIPLQSYCIRLSNKASNSQRAKQLSKYLQGRDRYPPDGIVHADDETLDERNIFILLGRLADVSLAKAAADIDDKYDTLGLKKCINPPCSRMPSPLDAARFLVFKAPLVLKTALFHVLKLSPTSTKWDLCTALTVTIIRDVLCNSPPSTISLQQRSTMQDPGVKGPIRVLGTGNKEYLTPALASVTAEWTGYRRSVPHNAPEPSISEADKYKCLVEETTTDVTPLYFHGGSYYLTDPCSHREVVASYAKLTGGRVLSVRYRLAPQNPFPSALLDALVVYLSLLYPPEGTLHSPVPPSHIVFGGDSADGNLATVLLRTILQLHRGYA
ncbi:hypothetical protein CNMCM8694_008063 [Aspergillus lentulus]|nr:hypothetical protein CNMCM8060_002692 [Aspergillus lentulus]KAF4194018.1 hypothetical protein CNMCM8694_008063 [Aspergillus lentulus]